MKRICIFLTSFIFCSAIYADIYQCKSDSFLFKEMIDRQSALENFGNKTEVQEFYEDYNYASLLGEMHLNKKFWKHEWISNAEYNKKIQEKVKGNESNEDVVVFYKMQPIKAAVQLSVGLVCIVPIQRYVNINDSQDLAIVSSLQDYIFINNGKDGWYMLPYSSDISNKNFQEFFPDFPKDLKQNLKDGVVEAQEAGISQ